MGMDLPVASSSTEKRIGAGAAAQAAFIQQQAQTNYIQQQAYDRTEQAAPVLSQAIDALPKLTPAPAPAPAKLDSSDEFDISNYDPLQAHAYDLSASAGFMPSPAPTQVAPAPANPVPTQQMIAPAPDQGQRGGPPFVPVQPRQVQQQHVIYHYPTQPQSGYTPAPGQATLVSAAPVLAPQPIYGTTQGPQGITTVQHQQYYQQQHVPAIQVTTPAPGAPPTQYIAPKEPVGDQQISNDAKRQLSSLSQSSVPKRQQLMFPSGMTTTVSPPIVPSASNSVNNDDDEIDPILRPPPENFATMSAEEKRRYERNVREQQRSFRISQQIKELRVVLSESGIPFKPNKFSILMSVVDYIKQLQARAIMVDAEHHKLIATLRTTNEMVNSGQIPSDSDEQTDKSSDITDDDMLFVQGLEYTSIFQQCSAALGVAALDGRILACNHEFSAVTGMTKDQLLRQSVFNLMQNHEEVFRAMGEMLSSTEGIIQTDKLGPAPPPLYWSGVVSQQNQQNFFMNITLARSDDGMPKFFSCALTAT